MDAKEQNHNINTPEEELPEVLQEALRTAYPDPRGKIAASVMEQIRAQREAEDKRIRGEKSKNHRRFNGLVMKWGGMAACMMILCGALVIAAPMMNRTDSVAEDAAPAEACLTAETAPETAAAEAYSYSALADEALEEVATEAVAMTRSAPVKQEAEVNENGAEADAGSGENGMLFAAKSASMDAAAEDACYDGGNEAFLALLIAEGAITEEQYSRWMTEKGYTDDEDWTKEELCAAFGIALE